MLDEGTEPSFAVHDRMVRFYGYAGVDDAEKQIRDRQTNRYI